MAITQHPASTTERDAAPASAGDHDSIAISGTEQAVEIELELVEEISIDGMCGVY